jgi:signal transduction histidine kinase
MYTFTDRRYDKLARKSGVLMETTATGELELAYLQKLDRYNYFATVLAILVITFSLFWMLFHIGGDYGTAILGNGAYILSAILAAIWCLTTAHRARYSIVTLSPKHQLAWLLIGLGLLANALGGICYSYLELQGLSPFPSISDVFFTLCYPLYFIGILLMPTRLRFGARMGLDTLITTLCLLALCWYFLIGPIYFSQVSHATSFTKIIELATALSYPCWDIMLLMTVVVLIQRRVDPMLNSSFIIFVLAIISCIWADSAYAYTCVFTMTYQTGTPSIDTFWFANDLLIGIAALSQYTAIVRQNYGKKLVLPFMAKLENPPLAPYKPPIKRLLFFNNALLYVPLAITLVLTAYSEIANDGPITHVLIIITILAAILGSLRFFMATHENETLLRQREQQRYDAQILQQMMARLTEFLELEPLRDRATRMMTEELHYDIAMLLLVAEHTHSLDAQSQVLVNALSRSGHSLNIRLPGESILLRTCLANKEVVVPWKKLLSDLPSEVENWFKAHPSLKMVFFPLTYQGKILGSMGVLRYTAIAPEPRDASLLKDYTKQIAVLIEHARLYQDTREHQKFSNALANIASRLNSAAVEATEISQLICEEGLSALQADFTVLYVGDSQDSRQKLVPLCVHMSDQQPEILSSPSSWPAIHMHEYEAQALHSLQPMLLYITPQNGRSERGSAEQLPLEQNRATTRSLTIVRETRGRATTLREILIRHHVRTAILTPLIARGEPVGILLFARTPKGNADDTRALDIADLAHAQDFGEQAGVAFTNARLYLHLHTAHQQLQELDHMKDQFMVTASHELRTPLTAVQGYIELMAEYDEMLPGEQRREFLQKARRGCDELIVLLGNVMDASRLEEEMEIKGALLKRVSVEEIIESIHVLIEPQLTQDQRELHLNIPSQLFAQADPMRLRQVLMNICTNALKYSPSGSPISISARATGNTITISIADKGNGIQPRDQQRIFQRFYRLESDINSPVRGSGLGLYISQRLITAMGGKIFVESTGNVGAGSTFHIQLPGA